MIANPLYNIQRDKNDDHAQKNVLGRNDLKYMAKFLGHVMKAGAHGNFFDSTLEISLWYRALLLGKREEQNSPGECSGERGSTSKESEDSELCLSSEIGNSATHCILAAGNYQQTMAAKLVAHMFVAEMIIHFCGPKALSGELLCYANYESHVKNAT